jgi:hypothetical protein
MMHAGKEVPSMSATTDPWEVQPGESPRAFEAFTLYRNMTPRHRSLATVCRELYGDSAGNIRLVEKWSSEWRWRDRAAAWDRELDRRTREAQVQARKDMAERHAALAVEVQTKALDRLMSLTREELSAGDALKMLVEGLKIERLARGEPEPVKEEARDDAAPVDVAELVRQREIAIKAGQEWRKRVLGTPTARAGG